MTLQAADNPPTFFPENFFQDLLSPRGNVLWLARTKSRQEKSLAWHLKSLKIAYFLPFTKKPQQNKKRLRLAVIPLFPGYLFFLGDQQDRLQVMNSGRVAQILEIGDQQTLVKELQEIQQLLALENNIELCNFIVKGKKVKIISGPFTGIEGIVQKRKNKTRLILQIQAIKQAVAIEIDINCTLPVS